MNRSFIKQIVLNEIYNVQQSQIVLLESVSSIQKIFASNNISPWTFRGLEAYSYDDAILGRLAIYSDGNADIKATNKTVPWEFKNNSIYIIRKPPPKAGHGHALIHRNQCHAI